MDCGSQPFNTDFSNEPKNAELIARLGYQPTFGGYLACYEHTVEHLFKSIDRAGEPIDLMARPLLFLMRHSMELGYKFTLSELHAINGEPYEPTLYNNHNLDQLHKHLRAQHAKAVEKYDLPESEVENFAEYCVKTEALLKIFRALDAGSFSFRYPIDKTGKPNFDSDATVDLVALKRSYNDAMILLRHTADVVGEYVDIHNQIAADFGGIW